MEKSIVTSDVTSETIVETEQAGKVNEQENKTCLNCGTLLTDVYCAHCGQKNIARRQSLGDLLINFLSSFWSFESKFLKTWTNLLFKPGKLALDYNAGKRERYFHPARFYVFVSFIFFLLSSTLPDRDENKRDFIEYTNKDTDEFSFDQFDTAIGSYKTKEQYDSAQRALPPQERDNFWMRKIREQEIYLNQRYKGKGKEFSEAFLGNYKSNVPKIFFLLLPFFALILKLLYIRRDFYYSEHLVFSIYFYNFFFLAGCLYLLIKQIPYGGAVTWIIIIWMLVYLPLAMKSMYRQRWWKTILKYGALMFIFSFFVLIAMALNLAISIMFL